MERLVDKYRIGEANLDHRKQFLRLDPRDIRLLAALEPWANRIADRLVREFYDYQFTFPSTLEFFSAHAKRRNMPISALRTHLEQAQAGYFLTIFSEAKHSGRFGVDYFEKRLKVGRLHNVINLPPKWYIGSYSYYQDLVEAYLWRSMPHRPITRTRAVRAIRVVFNYDVQAVMEAFLHDQFETIGFDFESIGRGHSDHDLSDQYDQVKAKVGHALTEIVHTARVLEVASGELSRNASQAKLATQANMASVRRVTGSAAQLTDNVEATASSIDEMSSSIHQVAGHSDVLATAVDETSASIEEMARSIQQVAGTLNQANTVAAHSSKAAEDGHGAVEQSIHGMDQINQAMDQVVSAIESLGDRSSEIGAIIVWART